MASEGSETVSVPFRSTVPLFEKESVTVKDLPFKESEFSSGIVISATVTAESSSGEFVVLVAYTTTPVASGETPSSQFKASDHTDEELPFHV